MTILMVLLGAMIGAPLRYLTDRAVQARHDSVFPWGTLTVNAVGSFVLGFLYAAGRLHGLSPQFMALAGTGFCGALTTYSTFSYESLRLLESRLHFYAAANVLASIVAGLGSALIGAALAAAL